jgi:sensor domain DACNV-containing protein
MQDLTYAGARSSAASIHTHLAQHRRQAEERGESELASLPSDAAIAQLIDAAFWASLRREEGYVPQISLAFLEPGETPHPLVLDRPIPLDPAALSRIAPAVERPGIHLGVHDSAAGLLVWGVARTIPKYCCVVEVTEPGLVVVKHHRGEDLAKFANVAVLQGDRVRLVDENASSLPDCPALLTSLLGFRSPGSWVGSTNVLVQLAVSMRAHHRGGLLLVVPAGTTTWRESLIQPPLYAVKPPFSELAALAAVAPTARSGVWRDDLARAVEAVAGLTAVDGATLLTSDYALLAFGAKVARRRGAQQLDQVMVTEPIEGGVAEVMTPSQLGGTRHLAAGQFVQDQRDAIALVASQDGRFTIFSWSPCEDMVHAHRVETLLL